MISLKKKKQCKLPYHNYKKKKTKQKTQHHQQWSKLTGVHHHLSSIPAKNAYSESNHEQTIRKIQIEGNSAKWIWPKLYKNKHFMNVKRRLKRRGNRCNA